MIKKTNLLPDHDLFPPAAHPPEPGPHPNLPLAVRMRPAVLEEILGQDHLLAEGKLLRRTIQSERWTSMIFYGPPGSGQTTLAQVISRVTQSRFVPINAVTSNVAELRGVIEAARKFSKTLQRTILFLDEIHRFNKAQQDVLMPDVENGTVILIGATTQNPCFAINGPLLSRSTIFELKALEEKDIIRLLRRAIIDSERGFGNLAIEVTEEALRHLAKNASGDARRALNSLEIGVLTTPPDAAGVIHFNAAVAEESCQRRIVYYDSAEDYHYDTVSAFIKSMRGSDVDAAIYWLAKMLYAGEDPRFIIRRILIFASEDIGNADPQALLLAAAGLQAIEFVGLPEAQIILGHLVAYLALAPKSRACCDALAKASADVKNKKTQEVPAHLRDRHYPGARQLGHGQGYRIPAPGAPHEKSGSGFNPDPQVSIPIPPYYLPSAAGFEKILLEKLKKYRVRP